MDKSREIVNEIFNRFRDGNNKKLIIVTLLILIGFCLSFLDIKKDKVEVVDTLSYESKWIPLTFLPDIAAISCSENGLICAAISSNYTLLMSQNGAESWMSQGRMNIGEDEIVGALVVKDNGDLIIGTGVDESAYTTIYKFIGNQWQTMGGEFGGISAASIDGSIAVGGNGLFLKLNDNTSLSRLPSCGRVNLYGVSHQENHIVVVGENGLIADSTDNGNNWTCNSLRGESGKQTLYSVSIAGNAGIAGGSKGYIYLLDKNNWKE